MGFVISIILILAEALLLSFIMLSLPVCWGLWRIPMVLALLGLGAFGALILIAVGVRIDNWRQRSV